MKSNKQRKKKKDGACTKVGAQREREIGKKETSHQNKDKRKSETKKPAF
jgi:hypothetical protein